MSTANITVRKNRLKVYPGNIVYLKDKEEFQLELFNSAVTTRLAKIAINGTLISNRGLVIKPGQKVYLERYIDTPKKFQFETYKVESGSSEVEKAIQNNGLVQVYWYDEYVQPAPINITYTTTHYPYWYNQQPYWCTQQHTGGNINLRSAFTTQNLTNTSGSRGFDMSFDEVDYSTPVEKETGRIEAGSHSNQTFTDYHGSFNSWIAVTNTIKILPFSEKPIEPKDLLVYCSNCRRKQKKGQKFCPNCGTQYDV